MRFIPQPYKIRDLKSHLDMTANKHNDVNYDQFIKFLDAGMGPTAIAKAMSVSSDTIYKWIKLHKEQT